MCSYALAHHFIPSNAPSLELQAWWFAQERAGIFADPITWAHDAFVWGHNSIMDIPYTLWSILTLASPEVMPAHKVGLAHERMAYVWPKVLLLCGGAACLIFER